MMVTVRESAVLRGCIKYLTIRRVFHYRNNTGAMKVGDISPRFVRFGAPGAPDLVAVIRGLYVGIETKSPIGKQTKDQMAFEASLVAAGGIYLLIRDVSELVLWVEARLR